MLNARMTSKDEVFRIFRTLLCDCPHNLPVSYQQTHQVQAEGWMDLHYLEMNFLVVNLD
jgi:hypothetical protein